MDTRGRIFIKIWYYWHEEPSGGFKPGFLACNGIFTGFFFTEQSGPSWVNQGWGLGFPLYPLVSSDTSFWSMGLCRVMVWSRNSMDLESYRPNHEPAVPLLCDLGRNLLSESQCPLLWNGLNTVMRFRIYGWKIHAWDVVGTQTITDYYYYL